ncbi:MAG: helix-turn-helix domain-containing protein [Roseburia sp.]|nr:helix-turn-helix domain-containing protein [Roseburia sp.]
MNFTGDQICYLRKKKHLSQEQLAEIIGVSRQTIYKWEYGLALPSCENIQSLCDYFEVDNNFFDPNKQDEIAVTATSTYINKKLIIIAICIVGVLLFISLIVTIALGICAFTPNTGNLTINNNRLDYQSFIVSLVITIILFITELVIICYALIKKLNVNRM